MIILEKNEKNIFLSETVDFSYVFQSGIFRQNVS